MTFLARAHEFSPSYTHRVLRRVEYIYYHICWHTPFNRSLVKPTALDRLKITLDGRASPPPGDLLNNARSRFAGGNTYTKVQVPNTKINGGDNVQNS